MEEYSVIKACQKRKAVAQKTLYEKYYNEMTILTLRYIPEKMDAEEVLSDSFIKCFKFIHQFEYRGVGSFRAWLSKIVVRECLAFLRKKKMIFFPIDQDNIEIEDEQESAIEKLQAYELFQLIQKLPVGYRTIFNLFAIENLRHIEIAELLGISVNTSKSQYMRARNYLKKQITDHEK